MLGLVVHAHRDARSVNSDHMGAGYDVTIRINENPRAETGSLVAFGLKKTVPERIAAALLNHLCVDVDDRRPHIFDQFRDGGCTGLLVWIEWYVLPGGRKSKEGRRQRHRECLESSDVHAV